MLEVNLLGLYRRNVLKIKKIITINYGTLYIPIANMFI